LILGAWGSRFRRLAAELRKASGGDSHSESNLANSGNVFSYVSLHFSPKEDIDSERRS
jgi:hypothetical protein